MNRLRCKKLLSGMAILITIQSWWRFEYTLFSTMVVTRPDAFGLNIFYSSHDMKKDRAEQKAMFSPLHIHIHILMHLMIQKLLGLVHSLLEGLKQSTIQPCQRTALSEFFVEFSM